MIRAIKDRYGHAVVIGGFRAAMPSQEVARLFAAATDLLEACESALPLLNLLAAKMDSPPEVIDTIRVVIDAIAKARGE